MRSNQISRHAFWILLKPVKRVALLVLVGWMIHPVTAANPKQPAVTGADKEKIAQLQAVSAQIHRYDMDDLVDPKYKLGGAAQMIPLLRKKVDLLADLEKTGGTHAGNYRQQRMVDLAMLCFYGEAAADAEIEQASKDPAPAAALIGKLGLCMRDWWAKQTPEDQAKVIDELRSLAKANASNDYIGNTLLTIALHRPATPELAESAREIVEKDLKGPNAIKYRNTPNRIGRPLAITGVTSAGKNFSTAPWKGKVILVDFWATWCPPCREEIPHVAKLYKDYHDKGLEIIGVSCDSNRVDLQRFLASHQEMSWPQLFGPQPPNGWHALAVKFGIDSIPRMYLIDRRGILRSVTAREKADKLIPMLLEESDAAASISPSPTTAGK